MLKEIKKALNKPSVFSFVVVNFVFLLRSFFIDFKANSYLRAFWFSRITKDFSVNSRSSATVGTD